MADVAAAATSSVDQARTGAAFPESSTRELLLTVSCRHLSSNSTVVALFEAKDPVEADATMSAAGGAPAARLLEYVGHTEGIRNSHHPDFQTALRILHVQGSGQKVKFNVYVLPPGDTRVEEHQRLGSAYVLLDEIASNLGEDLLVDLVHGHSAEKDRNNAWLKSHMLINARIAPPPGQEDEDKENSAVKKAAVATAKEGRVLTLHSDVDASSPPRRFLFFYREDEELGALHWLELDKADRAESKEPEAVPEEEELPEAGAGGARKTFKYSVPASYDAAKAVADDSLQVVRLIDVLAIYEGKQTASFRAHNVSGTPPPSDHCFSIILEDGSIDLECRSAEEREAFMLCIHSILTQQAVRERAKANQFRFLVKLRNLPARYTSRDSGLFVAASSRASKGLEYEVVGKTGWLASSITPDFPRALHAAFVSDTQSLKFDLFHNSLRPQDGLGTAIVDFKDLKAQVGRMLIVPMRNLLDATKDAELRKYKSVMLLECMEAQAHELEEEKKMQAAAAKGIARGLLPGANRPALHTGPGGAGEESDIEEGSAEDEEDDASDEGLGSDSEQHDDEYLGARLAELRSEHADVLSSGTGSNGRIDLGPAPSLASLPPLPQPPLPPRVSVSLFNGYLLDKYAFSSKSCSRKVVFAARDMDLEAEEAKHGGSAAAGPERLASPQLHVNTLSSPGPQGTGQTPHGAVAVTTFGHSPHTQAVLIAGAGVAGLERNPERMRLYWTKPEKGAGKTERREQGSSVRLVDITDLVLGKTTATLQRKEAAAVTEETALSIVMRDRTLDLVADTSDVRDALVSDLVNFLLPRSKEFAAYGRAGTGQEVAAWAEYERKLAQHKRACQQIETGILARWNAAQKAINTVAATAAAAAAAASGDPFALAASGDGDDGSSSSAPMPDLQAAMALLSKLHARGLAKLGINPTGLELGKKEQPDMLASLAALDDIFAEIDAKFANKAVTPNKADGKAGSTAGAGIGTDADDGSSDGTGSSGAGGDASAAKGAADEEAEPSAEERAKRLEEAERLAGLASPRAGEHDEDEEDEKAMAEIEARLAAAVAVPAPPADAEPAVGPDGVPIAPAAPDMSAFVVGDAPPPPPGPPPPMGGQGPAQVRRLKQLHWDPLAQEEVASTIFFNLQSQADFGPGAGAADASAGDAAGGDATTERLDSEQLDFLFANKAAKELKLGTAPKNKGVTLIDSKRAYNVEIGLSRLKMSLAELKQMLLKMDPAELTEEKAQILFDRVPSLEEMAQLRHANLPTESLGVVEQFLLMMSSIPQVGLRLECHLFMLRFNAAAAELKARLRVLFAACKSLSTSSHLRAVLEVVLQVGNHLNAGTRKGNAAGFKLASLPALSNTRSVDGRMTLLDFVAQHVDRTLKSPNERAERVPFLSSEMAPLKEAVNLDWAAVVEEQRRLAMQLKKIEALLAAPPPAADSATQDRFHERLQAFYPAASEEARLLASRLKRVVQLETSLLAYFGESVSKGMSLTALFSHFSTFTLAFEAAETKIKCAKPGVAGAAGAATRPKRGSRSQAAGAAGVGLVSAPGTGGGVLDPRLGNNFSAQLQGVKLRHQRRKSLYLTGAYTGRKTDTGRTIAPTVDGAAHGAAAGAETVVRAKRISISLGRGGVAGRGSISSGSARGSISGVGGARGSISGVAGGGGARGSVSLLEGTGFLGPASPRSGVGRQRRQQSLRSPPMSPLSRVPVPQQVKEEEEH